MTATQRRRAVEHLKNRRVSERRACRLIGFSRSAAWYRPKGRDDGVVRARLKRLAEQYPRYGYPTLHGMLQLEGLVVNRKRTYRLYREEGLQVRTKRRKKLIRPRIPMTMPERANERWSMDFVSDQLANGRRLRVLNVVDDFTRECVLQVVDFSISGIVLSGHPPRRNFPTEIRAFFRLPCRDLRHRLDSSPLHCSSCLKPGKTRSRWMRPTLTTASAGVYAASISAGRIR